MSQRWGKKRGEIGGREGRGKDLGEGRERERLVEGREGREREIFGGGKGEGEIGGRRREKREIGEREGEIGGREGRGRGRGGTWCDGHTYMYTVYFEGKHFHGFDFIVRDDCACCRPICKHFPLEIYRIVGEKRHGHGGKRERRRGR